MSRVARLLAPLSGPTGPLPPRTPPGEVVLTASAVTVELGGRTVVERADLTLRAGELVALVGPNGAGKSSLLGALAGDLDVTAGEIRLDGHPLPDLDPRILARRRAVLPQHASVSFPFTVEEVVRMGRAPLRGTDADAHDDNAVDHALAAVDLDGLRERPAPQLSGGEKARMAAARVLAQATQVLLLDEPTAALDLHHEERLLAAVQRRVRSGDLAVVVLHDLTQAAAHADRVVMMAAGRIVADGPPDEVLAPDLVRRVYAHPVTVLRHPATDLPVVVVDPLETRSPAVPATDTDTTTPFSVALRRATAPDHRAAEKNRYLDALLDGKLDLDGYARIVVQHWHIYRALEAVARSVADDPAAAPFLDPDLERVPALEEDLAHLLGPDWREAAATPLPATAGYVERIEACAGWTGGLVAHHYTRYLGDLSGGLFIGRRIEEIYAFGDGPGARFYVFDRIPDPAAFKAAYRAALDAAPWDAAERRRVTDEAHAAYAANIAVFDDLGAEVTAR